MAGNPQLIDQYRNIHATETYGNTSVKNLRFIRPEIQLLRPGSIIDYGCGQSRLLDELDLGYEVRTQRYDPAIPAYQTRPDEVFDLLINVDVLEHIEEKDLDEVIADMRSLCRDALIIVDTAPAALVLEDGRNAHVTLQPHEWWQARLSRHFGALERVGTARRTRAGFKTWSRASSQNLAFAGMRIAESARFYARKLVRRH
ncbi:MAG: hypothetical protein RLZ98_3586 [Pseudomonadota bacterium]